jgi:small subunit ribosomal protein S1
VEERKGERERELDERVDDLSQEGGDLEGERVNPMEHLLEEEGFGYKGFQQGDIVEGTLVKVSRQAILVHVGAKSEGIVATGEVERLSDEDFEGLREGSEILVYIINPEGREGNPILSLERARLQRDWRVAEEKFRNGEVFSGIIRDFNRGGFIIGVGEVRGFLPLSQVEGIPRRQRDDFSLKGWMKEMRGQEVWVKIIEMDQRRNRLILSQREAEKQRRHKRKRELLSKISEGETVTGVVSTLCDFGAFVDVGGADGLVHLSELSWRRGVKPEDMLEVGQEVDVYILNVDPERGRIGLSLKRLQEEPWDGVEERYLVGQVVEGTITKVTSFGAFARLDDYIEGLIHISELSDRKVSHPKEVVKDGDVLPLRVLRVDPERRRIALSFRQVEEHEYEDLDWKSELSYVQMEGEESPSEETPEEVTGDVPEAEDSGAVSDATAEDSEETSKERPSEVIVEDGETDSSPEDE